MATPELHWQSLYTARDAEDLPGSATVAAVLAATASLGEVSSVLGTSYKVVLDMIQELQGLADGVAEERRLLNGVPNS